MTKLIPGFSIPQSTSGYDIYQCTKQMVKNYSGQFKDYYKNAEGTRQLAKIMFRNNLSKLYRQRLQWDSLQCPVPKEYFDALGITERILSTTIEIDQEQYEQQIQEPVTYSSAFLQIRSFVHQGISFDSELSEYEAIEQCRILQETRFSEDEGDYLSNKFIILSRDPLYNIVIGKNTFNYHYERPDYSYKSGRYHFNQRTVLGWSLK